MKPLSDDLLKMMGLGGIPVPPSIRNTTYTSGTSSTRSPKEQAKRDRDIIQKMIIEQDLRAPSFHGNFFDSPTQQAPKIDSDLDSTPHFGEW